MLFLTNASISLQNKARFAGTLEAAQRIQTISILTDSLQGALVDVFTVRRREARIKRLRRFLQEIWKMTRLLFRVVTLTVSAVKSLVALWTCRAVFFHNGVFDRCI